VTNTLGRIVVGSERLKAARMAVSRGMD
jgi:hypothetical protein